MKIIELLNKIANGDEVPKKIQVYSDIFVLDEGNKLYEHESTRTNLLSIYNGNILNYEVKIKKDKPFNERVEEIYNRYIDYIYDKKDKKIEKLENDKQFYSYRKYADSKNDIDKILYILRGLNLTEEKIDNLNNKINEIIEFLYKTGRDK